ncbi:MAG: phospholipid carrier-dependent glycosyltransferase, partial [Rhodanobacteraceae bacterium]
MKRTWFSPDEGRTPLTRVDVLIASGLTIATFILMAIHYTWPSHWYFDEIYYPRSAEEYLTWAPQYEWTHPPLTKELIAFSIAIWGGLHSALGNTAYGWRFMNVVVGALMVFSIYAFAKRITASTAFSTIAAVLLALDGFHFTQSRIATPEIVVAFLTLATTYAFYRYWIAAEVRRAPVLRLTWPVIFVAGTCACALAGFAIAYAVAGRVFEQWPIAIFAVGAYLTLLFYLIWRTVLLPRLFAAASNDTFYPDGSVARTSGASVEFRRLPAGNTARKGGRVYTDGVLSIAYNRDGSIDYATPEGSARFAPGGSRDATLWLWILGLICGLAAAA